jgi:hypothetical protein
MNFGIAKLLAHLGFYLTSVESPEATWSRLRPKKTENTLIRLGTKNGDGGYLIPDNLDFDGCLSAGLADNLDFEVDVAQIYGCPVHMIDGSIQEPVIQHSNFFFRKLFLGAVSGGQFISFEDWYRESGLAENLLLKVDIEGAEYPSFLGVREETMKKFKVMIFELHSLEQLATKLGNSLISSFLDKVSKNHTIIHSHANNVGGTWNFGKDSIPSGLEITLIRNDCVEFVDGGGYAALPHTLDRKCDPLRRDVIAKWG